VATAAAVVGLARRLGVEMPITEAVAAVMHRGVAIDQTIEGLLRRPFRSE
jgi:glycerol-3-phosphate dehydrogenase (NAD(P)+)